MGLRKSGREAPEHGPGLEHPHTGRAQRNQAITAGAQAREGKAKSGRTMLRPGGARSPS